MRIFDLTILRTFVIINTWSSGDKPLKEALVLMNSESVTSLAVVDNQYNVIGNISNVDVKVRNRSPLSF